MASGRTGAQLAGQAVRCSHSPNPVVVRSREPEVQGGLAVVRQSRNLSNRMTTLGPSSIEGPSLVSSGQHAGFGRVRPEIRAGISSEPLGAGSHIRRVLLLAADACRIQCTSGARIRRDGIRVILTVDPKEFSQEDSPLGRGLLSSLVAAVFEKSFHLVPYRRSASRRLPAAGHEESEP